VHEQRQERERAEQYPRVPVSSYYGAHRVIPFWPPRPAEEQEPYRARHARRQQVVAHRVPLPQVRTPCWQAEEQRQGAIPRRTDAQHDEHNIAEDQGYGKSLHQMFAGRLSLFTFRQLLAFFDNACFSRFLWLSASRP